MRKILYLLLCLFFLIPNNGCEKAHEDQRLSKVYDIVNENPKEAIDILDSIDPVTLSEADRHFYDFLSIKAKDKAYIWHKSDSLILDVKKWYASNPKYGLYPEAVYYTARVYSDLGDKPTALRYFQEALDLLPEEDEDRNLRLRILSQT